MTKIGDNPRRLPKRFYAAASAGERGVLLDGRVAKTKAGSPLSAPHPRLMEAAAREWNEAGEHIDFGAMPMTRFLMTLIDLGERDAPEWRATLASFLKSDLLCYRAAEPAALVARQRSAWDPLLGWAATQYGLALACGEGVAFVAQHEGSMRAGERIFSAETPAVLLGMKTAAEISGSAVIALALARRAFDAKTLFDASRIDEAFQTDRWGVDKEAADRAERLRRDFNDVATYLTLL